MKLHRSCSGPAALSAAEPCSSLGQFPKVPVPIVHSFPSKERGDWECLYFWSINMLVQILLLVVWQLLLGAGPNPPMVLEHLKGEGDQNLQRDL